MGKGNYPSSITLDLCSDDMISATENYGDVAVTTITIPFEYKYAELVITEATPNYAYITINGGNSSGIYSSISSVTNIKDMTAVSITCGTGYHSHHKCKAAVTFYF